MGKKVTRVEMIVWVTASYIIQCSGRNAALNNFECSNEEIRPFAKFRRNKYLLPITQRSRQLVLSSIVIHFSAQSSQSLLTSGAS